MKAQPPMKEMMIPKTPPWRRELFNSRPTELEDEVTRDIFNKGIDQEDIKFLKTASDQLLLSDNAPKWSHLFHWVDYPATIRPDSEDENGPSEGGCARCTPYKRTARRILHLRKNATVDATVGHVRICCVRLVD